MPPNPTGPTNRQLRMLTRFLRKAAALNSARIWSAVADLLERPGRRRVVVNVGKLEKLSYVKDGDSVVIPGKLLGGGVLRKRVTVAAYKVSKSAVQKVLEAGGEVLTIPEVVRRSPKGSGVKIVI
jgi:large subunit ribosomal protein L18e